VDDALKIPLHTIGTKIFFNSRSPTASELSRIDDHIHITGTTPWEPSNVTLGKLSAISHQEPIQPIPNNFIISDEIILHSIEPSLVNVGNRIVCETRAHELYNPNELQPPPTMVSHKRHNKIEAENLSEIFGIGIKRTEATIHATTQKGRRSATMPISHRYRADRMYAVQRLEGKFSTNTLYGICKSLQGYVASQIYSNKCGFMVPYHMNRINGENVGTSLGNFIHEYGAPAHLTFDGAQYQKGDNTKFMALIRQHNIKYHISSPRRPEENLVKGSIREIKKRAYRIKQKYQVPDRLWDYLVSRVCETACLSTNSSRYANARTPMEIITGKRPDISEYLNFPFYCWVTFRQQAGLGELQLGRWLGVSHKVGMLMSYWILPPSGIPISCVMVQKLTYLEQQTDEYKSQMEAFSRGLEEKFKTKSSTITDAPDVASSFIFDIEGESEEFIEEYTRVINDKTLPHAEDEVHNDNGDNYLNMELGFRRGDKSEPERAVVKRRAMDKEGKYIGIGNGNPLLDSRLYEVEYENGTVETMAANMIVENLLAQVDKEVNMQTMLDEIIDHCVDGSAISIKDGTFTTQQGYKQKNKTTRGWELCVQWKGGSTDWVQLKDMKDSYPIEVAEYAKNLGLEHEPAFAWWVPFVVKKKDRLIKKVKSKYWTRTHKYGIRTPKSVEEARKIDAENGNILWMDAVRLGMKNIMVAFVEYHGDESELEAYKQITGHIVFDVKLVENFRRKARYCADGHKTSAPSSLTYSTVVARDSVQIMLLIAALNGLSISGADIQNAFLSAPNREKNYLIAGPEFGEL